MPPKTIINPGQILLDELKARKIRQNDLAELTGMQRPIINEIINGKRQINTRYAVLIATALNMDPIIWINLQKYYELDVLYSSKSFKKEIEQIKERLK